LFLRPILTIAEETAVSKRFDRRNLFERTAAVACGAALGARAFAAPAVLAQASPNSKVAAAVIAYARRCFPAMASLNELAKPGHRIVALANADEREFVKVEKTLSIYPDVKFDAIEKFIDYRRMFDKLQKQIDVVFVHAPNHHHATASMMAMKLGKAVYCEKPLAHSIHECRTLAEAAKRYKVVTQLGNQGHSGEGIRRLCEYIWAGAIGNVTEVHVWAPTGLGGTGGRPPALPVPKGLHWDEWIGPAQYRDYHDDLYPIMWPSWCEFGDGSLGDWGCHNLDGPFWALNLGQPTSAEQVMREGGSDERYPLINVVRWDFPAREKLPPVQVFWYDGYKGAKTANPYKDFSNDLEEMLEAQNRPPIVLELEKKYDRKFGDGGAVFVGDKGIIVAGNYCESPRIVPEEQHKVFPVLEKTLPRVKGSHQANFLNAFIGGTKACSDFEYGAALTEMILVGCLAEKAGLKKKVEWDTAKMACTNMPELDRMVRREYRQGWEL
jgi:predicted dehydrogenase